MTRNELEKMQDAAADEALRARERLEAAIDNGDLPVWVLEVCSALERASLNYGEASARLKLNAALIERSRASALH